MPANGYLYFEFDVIRQEYQGEPYQLEDYYGKRVTSTRHSGIFKPRHINGYAYNLLKLSSSLRSAELVVRWKSMLIDYEYIEPDDGLDIKQGDFKLEICTGLPEELYSELKTPNNMDKNQYYFHEWEALLETVETKNLPLKGIRFPCEMNNDFPDVIFAMFFPNPVTQNLIAHTEEIFEDFISNWNEKQERKGGEEYIHGIMLVNSILGKQKANEIHIRMDFGNCKPKVLGCLIRYLSKSDLEIEKLVLN